MVRVLLPCGADKKSPDRGRGCTWGSVLFVSGRSLRLASARILNLGGFASAFAQAQAG